MALGISLSSPSLFQIKEDDELPKGVCAICQVGSALIKQDSPYVYRDKDVSQNISGCQKKAFQLTSSFPTAKSLEPEP